MSNIVAALKAEITRIARKTIRTETSGPKKAIAPFRSEIADLKRRTRKLEQQLRRSQKVASGVTVAPQGDADASGLRFGAKGFVKHRQRLGLSQKGYGALIGVSPLTVYKWGQGEVRPRPRFLPSIARIRKIGKKGSDGTPGNAQRIAWAPQKSARLRRSTALVGAVQDHSKAVRRREANSLFPLPSPPSRTAPEVSSCL